MMISCCFQHPLLITHMIVPWNQGENEPTSPGAKEAPCFYNHIGLQQNQLKNPIKKT